MRFQTIIAVCAIALLAGCGARPVKPRHAVRHGPPAAVRAPAAAPRPVRSAAVAQARSRVEEAGRVVPQWRGGEWLLAAARKAERAGDAAQADRLATQAIKAVDLELDSHYRRLALAELEKSYTYSGMTNEQVAFQDAFAALIIAGESKKALAELQTLNADLEQAARNYTVRPGDTLWLIARRPDVYNNGWLWPLLWNSNRDELRSPDRLYPGMVLEIREHPTLGQIAQALGDARALTGRTVRIGVIRELRPGAPP